VKKIFLLLCVSAITLMASSHTLEATPYNQVKKVVGKGEPYFLEVGSEHCWACQKMGKLLYKFKQKHPQANIAFIDVQKERKAAFELGVRMIPTQIFYNKKGVEVYRHVGALSESELENLFNHF